MKKILIVNEPKQAELQVLLSLIKEELKKYDWLVSQHHPSQAHSPAHFMGVLICGPTNMEISECQTLGWVKKYGKILTQKSSAFISVGSDLVESKTSKLLIPRKKMIADTLSSLGYAPRMIEVFNEKNSEQDILKFADRFAQYVTSHSVKKAV